MKRNLLPLLMSVVMLSACGGGGGHATPTTAATATAGSGASTNRTPVGHATLTIKLPAGFNVAKTSATARTATTAASTKKTAASTVRKPSYVNSLGAYIDIWSVDTIGQTAVHAVDSTNGPNLTPNPDGTQTFTVPIYSTSANEIVAFQTDTAGGFGNILTIGEADLGTFVPGSAPQVSLTMFMAANHIGIMTDPDNRNMDASVLASYPSQANVCTAPTPLGPFYFFTADHSGGFIATETAGVGGISQPTVVSSTSDSSSPANTFSQAPGLGGGYSVTLNNIIAGETVKLAAGNPAWALADDAVNSRGVYPGVDYLYQHIGGFFATLSGIDDAGATISATIDILPSRTCTFVSTGVEQDFTVPNVTSVILTVVGSAGSGGIFAGNGGSVYGSLPVTPGDVLAAYVGGNTGSWTGGYNGGGNANNAYGCNSGGGGASDVRQGGKGANSRVMVAGGGGGGGCANGGGGGTGGAGGLTGGNGADIVAAGGGFGGAGGTGAAAGTGGAGGNGSYSVGGTGGNGNGGLLISGVGGVGGSGGTGGCGSPCGDGLGGSGGGGGFYGGGGGGGGGGQSIAVGLGGAGGGGGSDYASPAVTVFNYDANGSSGTGTVTITY